MANRPSLIESKGGRSFAGRARWASRNRAKLPDTWSTTTNVRWKTAIPGHGWSSPIVWGDRIFVTSVVPAGDTEAAEARASTSAASGRRRRSSTAGWCTRSTRATGKIAWEREAHRGVPPGSRHLKNTYASETPTTDGERVYVTFGNVGIFAYDLTGKLVWSQPLGPFPTRNGWGTAASPVLHKGRLYIINDNDLQSYLTALDARTGKTVWRVDRKEGTNWASPYIWEHAGRTEIITSATGNIRSYDLEGKLLWQLGPMSSIAIPTPFSKFGLLYVASGYVGDQVRPVYAIKPGASGDISLPKGTTTNDSIAWSLPQGGPYNPSPIIYGDYYYTLFDRGFFTCHDARTGKEIYTKVRLDPTASGFTSSPWAYNGKIFAMSEDGTTYVIQAGPEFKVIGQNVLDEFTMASPAIDRDSLIIRTAGALYRIGGE